MMPAGWWAWLDRAGFDVVRLLLSALWQSSLLFVAAGGLCWLLRRRRPAARHAVWVAALLLAPALPALTRMASSVGSPQAPVPVIPAYVPPAPLPPAPAPLVEAPPPPVQAPAPPVQAPPPAPAVAFEPLPEPEPQEVVAARVSP